MNTGRLLAAATLLAGCSDASSTPPGAATGEGASPLGVHVAPTAPPRGGVWVTVRHVDDAIWLHAVEPPGVDVHVASLDLSGASLEDVPDEVVLAAEDDAALLRGKFEPPASCDAAPAPAFSADAAYRGLPGRAFGDGDVFEQGGRALGAMGPPVVHFPDLGLVEPPWIDRAWLEHRVADGAAVVAGHEEGTFVATQVFVPLPDRRAACAPGAGPLGACCAADATPTYRRDADRCLEATGCATPGECTLLLPRCEPGYELRSWAEQPAACPAFVCDPAFLPR